MQSVEPVIDAERLIALQEGARSIHVDEAIRDWVVEISAATRVRPELFLGVSPRGSLALVLAARAFAAISGRAYATPDDVKAVAGPVLTHRLVLKPETRMRGASPAAIIEEVMDSVACPLNYAKR
jgi:MoxR-like ATPase